jgi:hypothetical protein
MSKLVRIVCAAIALTACGAGAPSEEADRAACERYRDHLIDLRLGNAPDKEAHRTALRASLGETPVDECLADLSRDDVQCALAATDFDQLTACNNR